MSRTRKIPALEAPPWSALRRAGEGVIEGYLDATRTWHPVAEVRALPDTGRRAVGDFIMRALTEHTRQRALIPELIDALELCLQSGGLNWEAEHDAEIVLERAKRIA